MSLSEEQPAPDRPDPARLLAQLELVRRKGWWEFRAREVQMLAERARDPLPGEKPEKPIQDLLLDLLDPEPVNEQGRKLGRPLLAERDPRDPGLLGRILFAEPPTIEFEDANGKHSLTPRTLPLTARYRSLEVLRGEGRDTINRTGGPGRKPGPAIQLTLDLRDALLVDWPNVGNTQGPTKHPSHDTHDTSEGAPENGSHPRRRRARAALVLVSVAASTSLAVIVQDQTSPAPSLTGPAESPTSTVGWWPPRGAVVCGGDLLCGGTRFNALNRYVFRPANGKPYPTGIPDERAFLSFVGSAAGQPLVDPLHLSSARQVKIMAVVDNAASASLASPNADQYGAEEAATAHDVRVSFLLPRGCRRQQQIIGVVSHHEDGGRSEQITDSATLRSTEPICVKLIPNAAGFYNHYINEPLDDTLAGTYDPERFDRRAIRQTGPQVGCRRMDGRLYSSFMCAGYATAAIAVYRPGSTPNLSAPPRNSAAAVRAAPIGQKDGLKLQLSKRGQAGARITRVVGSFAARATLNAKTSLENATLELVLPNGASPDAPIGVRLRSSSGSTAMVHGVATLSEARFVEHAALPSIRGPGVQGATLDKVVIAHAKAGQTLTVKWPLVAIEPKLKIQFEVRRPHGRWHTRLRYSARTKRIEWRITIDSGGIGLDAPSLWLLVPAGLRLTGAPVVESPNGQRNTMFIRQDKGATTARGEAVSLPTNGRITIRFAADDLATRAPTKARFVRLILGSSGYQKTVGAQIYETAARTNGPPAP